MLRSMTGFGEARFESERLLCAVEIRSVNNRYLKISIKIPDSYGAIERDLEHRLRERVRRGTVSVDIQIHRVGESAAYRIDRCVLEGYLRQLEGLVADPAALLGPLLTLPGVVQEGRGGADPEDDRSAVEATFQKALAALDASRAMEGDAMAAELAALALSIEQLAARIAERAPASVSGYRDRLGERVRGLLGDRGIAVDPSDLIREVSLFAERSDVGEELIRLRSHLAQFHEVLSSPTSEGRRLDFLSQEMYRESNTIGSKAGDATIAQLAVDLKSLVERVREIVQNVE